MRKTSEVQQPMSNPTVLICDDSEAVHESLSVYLSEAGIDHASVYDGEAALAFLERRSVDLVILDIMLPKLFGTEVCKAIRRRSDVPIIILSAKVDESDRIVGLELGADNYVTKPFSPKEVVARVRTVLRRVQPRRESDELHIGRLLIRPKAYEVYMDNAPVKLTPRECELLTFLVSRAGEVVSREEILDAVWGIDYFGDVRAVDTLLARLRTKIKEHCAGVRFCSIYGVGYKLEEMPDAEEKS